MFTNHHTWSRKFGAGILFWSEQYEHFLELNVKDALLSH